MSRFHTITPLLQGFVDKGPPGCACLVTQGGETKYEHYYGQADLETMRPIAPDTIYRIFSMTKVVTVTTALMLYERGMFLLNDLLEDYLPEFKEIRVYRPDGAGTFVAAPAKQPIRIKDLFTMTAGLSYFGHQTETEKLVTALITESSKKAAAGQQISARDFSKAMAGIPLEFDPGTRWKYSFCHDILGALIEVLSGKRLGEFMKEHIFAPLGMSSTFFQLPKHRKDQLCTLYDLSPEGKLTPNYSMDYQYEPGWAFDGGGGGLLSTIGDYGIFASMLAAGGTWKDVSIIGRKTIELMATNHLSGQPLHDFKKPAHLGYGYGLGVRVMMDRPEGGSNGSIGEFGWNGLAGTWMMVDPQEQLAAVYMQQSFPSLSEYRQPRLRAAIYGAL